PPACARRHIRTQAGRHVRLGEPGRDPYNRRDLREAPRRYHPPRGAGPGHGAGSGGCMASFTITPARGYIALEPSTRRGSLTVSVQNTSGIERELRATVAAEDEASGVWLRVREASQRARDREVVQFVVEAEAPPAAAEGSYGFTLRVVAEDDP